MGWCADFVLGETGALQFFLHWRPAELVFTPSSSCSLIPAPQYGQRWADVAMCTYVHVFVNVSSAQDTPLHHSTDCPSRAQMILHVCGYMP